jgi:NADPH-dependent 2,4-dienoyl-CoA reductase/sulfur reductase-like enzyme
MITDEPHLPYDRMALSKRLYTDIGTLQLRPPEHFAKLDIEVKHGTVVTKVDAAKRQVTCKAVGGEEDVLTYDSILVASGSSPRSLSCPGSMLKGVYTLRKQEDAPKIARHARKGQKMIVVGGSFLGMEMASTLRAKGCDVSIIARESVPCELVLGRQIGLAFARLLQKEGVRWYGGSQIRNIRGSEIVNGVELEDGEVLPADAIIVGIGAQPNTSFVDGASLDKEGGIIVGPLLSSADAPSLFAAGDVCSYASAATDAPTRSQHWNVAIQQGRAAARNMLSRSEPYTTIPFFSSQLFGKSLSFVGRAPDLNEVIVEGDVSTMEFVAYYIEQDEVKAVATLNSDSMAVICAETMRRGAMPRVHEIMLGVVNADVILRRLQSLR